MKSKPIIAVIGSGHWGKNLIREFSKVTEIKYIFSRNPEKVNPSIRDNFNIVSDMNTILNDKDVQIIVIATPIPTHYELAKKALLAGKNVYVEKSTTNSYKATKELYELAKKKKKVLFTGYIQTYSESTVFLKEIIKKEKPQKIIIGYSKFGTFHENILYNSVSHHFSIPNFWGFPVKKYELILSAGVVTACDDILITGQSGKTQIVIFHDRIADGKDRSIKVITAKNVYRFLNDNVYVLNQKTGEFDLIFTPKETPLESEIKAFLNSVNNGKTEKQNQDVSLATAKDLDSMQKKLKI